MDKKLKKRLLGAFLVFSGFTLMAVYPYLMYMRGEETSYVVVKATLTILILLLGMGMAALGGLLAKGADSAEDSG